MKVATKTDMKGQQTQYSYDSLARLTQVRHYPTPGKEDTNQRVTYGHDNAPSVFTGTQYTAGPLTSVSYQTGAGPVTEYYNYSGITGQAGCRGSWESSVPPEERVDVWQAADIARAAAPCHPLPMHPWP